MKLKYIKYSRLLLILFISIILLTGCTKDNEDIELETDTNINENLNVDNNIDEESNNSEENNVDNNIDEESNNSDENIIDSNELGFSIDGDILTYKDINYTIIEVDGGDLNGNRKANVAVDIGYGDRIYWGLTNEYSQLVYVLALDITLQDENNEEVNYDGRYYREEAFVPGVEYKDLDQGHVIADSLGGVANAYNITPQDSIVNRHGDQAYMEKIIRQAGGCSNFVATITYANKSTQIPSTYHYEYELMGDKVVDEFDNVNPNTVTNEENDSNITNNESDVIVYWTDSGKSYHTHKECSALRRSKDIQSGALSDCPKSDPCDRCH